MEVRNIFNLSERLMAEVPKDAVWIPFKNAVNYLNHEYRYKAPEQWIGWYNDMSKILDGYLGEPNTPWKINIMNIFALRKI